VALAFVRVWVYMDGGVPLRRCGVWVHEAGRPSDCALYMAGYTNCQLLFKLYLQMPRWIQSLGWDL